MENAKGYMEERKRNLLKHMETLKFEKQKLRAEVDKFTGMEVDCKKELEFLEAGLKDLEPKPEK